MTNRPPVWTTRLSAPGAEAFAIMSGLETLTRALVAAALPLQTKALFGNDESVSVLFLVGAVAALSLAPLLPGLAVRIGRARLCVVGILVLIASFGLFVFQAIPAQAFGFILRAIGTAMFTSIVSMFIMDHVRRDQLGRSEPLRLLYIGFAWTIGPILGVKLDVWWGPWAPFAASMVAAFALLAYFVFLRLSNDPVIASEQRKVETVSIKYLREYLREPRLILAWVQGVGRSFFWGTFNNYTAIFAVGIGLGAETGGYLVGIGSAFILAMPLWGWCSRRFGIRRISLICFPLACAGSFGAGLLTAWPWLAVASLLLATLSMSIIDGYGNSLFLRACKPSQRTSMTPVFSTHRDFGDIGNAAAFAVMLSFFPIQVVFIAAGAVLAGIAILALWINPRL